MDADLQHAVAYGWISGAEDLGGRIARLPVAGPARGGPRACCGFYAWCLPGGLTSINRLQSGAPEDARAPHAPNAH
jgi:hypothetical protein